MNYSRILAPTLLAFLFLFSGCAGREYFADKNATPLKGLSSVLVKSDNDKQSQALFEDKNYFVFVSFKGFELVAKDSQKTLSFASSIIVSAHIYDGKVAVLTRGNELLLYRIADQELLFSHKEKVASVMSAKTAQIQESESQLFVPFLNAKIAVFDKKKQLINKFFTLADGSLTSNIISLTTHKNKLIGHTKERLFIIRNGQLISKPLDTIKDIALTSEHIIVASHIGDIVAFNYNLVTQKKLSFKYANFTHLVHTNDTLFATTKNGYLLQLNSALEKQNIYFSSLLKTAKVTTANDTLYLGNYQIDLAKLANTNTQK